MHWVNTPPFHFLLNFCCCIGHTASSFNSKPKLTENWHLHIGRIHPFWTDKRRKRPQSIKVNVTNNCLAIPIFLLVTLHSKILLQPTLLDLTERTRNPLIKLTMHHPMIQFLLNLTKYTAESRAFIRIWYLSSVKCFR